MTTLKTDTKNKKTATGKRKSFLSSLRSLILFIIISSIAITYLSLIAFHFIRPFLDLKSIVQQNLEQALQSPVTIGKISINPFTGIKLDDFSIEITDHNTSSPFFSVKQVILDYDLAQLIKGALVINEIVIDSPKITALSSQGKWNFDSLVKGTKKNNAVKKEEPEQKIVKEHSAPPQLPLLPLTIDLKKILLSNIDVSVMIDNTISAQLTGINIECRVKLEGKSSKVAMTLSSRNKKKRAINLSVSSPSPLEVATDLFFTLLLSGENLNAFTLEGDLSLKNIEVKTNQQIVRTTIRSSLDLLLNLKEESVTLNSLSLAIGEKNIIALNDQINDFLHSPKIEMVIKDSFLSITELFSTARPLLGNLPIEDLSGTISIPHLNLTGTIDDVNHIDAGNTFALSGKIQISDISTTLPPHDTEVEDMSVSITMENIKYNNKGYYVSISNADRHSALDYIRTIYHGIDLGNFSLRTNPEEYLLFFGRIHHDKGTKEAIEIAKKAGKKLIIAGLFQSF